MGYVCNVEGPRPTLAICSGLYARLQHDADAPSPLNRLMNEKRIPIRLR